MSLTTSDFSNRSAHRKSIQRYRSSWGVDYQTARKFGYPIRRISVIEELEARIEALEAAIAIGTVIDLDGVR